MTSEVTHLPIIDISPLVEGGSNRLDVAGQISRACREAGFFYIKGHGIDKRLTRQLEDLSREFFARSTDEKLDIGMEKGGRAWRGYFPVGGELTSGKPDLKEGLYFGAEKGEDDPQVSSGTPMHGRNLFPKNLPGFRNAVLTYLTAMTSLGHTMMKGIALSLGLSEGYFAERYTGDPLILFRIFNYPAELASIDPDGCWGVGEHTDYGLLTILGQDPTGGLQVRTRRGWVDAEPVADAFVCNIGDMLDRMTGGFYHSTAHRVRRSTHRDRLAFPFFFDPNFNAEVKPIEMNHPLDDNRDARWDRQSVHDFSGTYGDYLLSKVGRVFPHLRREVL